MRVRASAPIRVCDLGGWTDTWFSSRGRVLSIAVQPGISCSLELKEMPGARAAVTVLTPGGEPYSFFPELGGPGRSPLIEAVICEHPLPPDTHAIVSIESQVPPGAGTGTSAAAAVALSAALRAALGKPARPEEVWREAHRIETETLGLESGIQDQITAAYGGICFIDIPRYPEAAVEKLAPGGETLRELESCLLLIFLGRAHESSQVHLKVIERLKQSGPGAPELEALRRIPLTAREALLSGDLDRFGELMVENNEAQRRLSPELISPEADAVIEFARSRGARGWKVNGAGGQGGSLTLLLPGDAGERESFLAGAGALKEAMPGLEIYPLCLDLEGMRIEVLH